MTILTYSAMVAKTLEQVNELDIDAEVIDLRSLDRAGITANKNAIPFDPEKPMITSGIRLGTPAATSRGFGIPEFQQVGRMIGTVLDGLATSNSAENAAIEAKVGAEVRALCARFPMYAV